MAKILRNKLIILTEDEYTLLMKHLAIKELDLIEESNAICERTDRMYKLVHNKILTELTKLINKLQEHQ